MTAFGRPGCVRALAFKLTHYYRSLIIYNNEIDDDNYDLRLHCVLFIGQYYFYYYYYYYLFIITYSICVNNNSIIIIY